MERISEHSCRVDATQDLVNSDASLTIIMIKGSWKKTEIVVKYIEKTKFLFL
jgi:hypothetical protein